MLDHYWLDMGSEDFFVTKEEVEAKPEVYNKDVKDMREFEIVVNEQGFFADASIDENDDSEEEPYYEDDYAKEIKKFDRSFKQVYVGYADGIDLNALDSSGNWQFDAHK